jgi:molybdopterin synthase catalytic subunit
VLTSVRGTAITVAECEAAVANPAAGATVSFAGVVRDHDDGRAVTELSYEAHPHAAAVIDEIVSQARALPGVLGAVALHRVGDLAVGDVAFVAAASAAHRGEAFAACAWLVDEVKARAPIWKHQLFSDGTSQWVNSP